MIAWIKKFKGQLEARVMKLKQQGPKLKFAKFQIKKTLICRV
jgi:hypothetical protein